MKTKLTSEQKLTALSLKHFSDLEWIPKKGDYYTTSRDDLELYKIVDETHFLIMTKYCDPDRGDEISKWFRVEKT